jgi:nicotinamidase/pyrazinamidase
MRALVIVDLQNDFCPGGALPVADGDKVIPIANRLQPYFELVVATQDWHPRDHGSFAANHRGRKPGEIIDLHGLPQVLWPIHCVQESPGADFHKAFDQSRVERVFRKGTDPMIEGYSGFFDNGHRKSTGLGDFLKSREVTDVYLCGLTTDYCVRFSSLDAVRLGFQTWVIEDGCRAVNLKSGDAEQALAEMRAKGVRVVASQSIGGNHPSIGDDGTLDEVEPEDSPEQ